MTKKELEFIKETAQALMTQAMDDNDYGKELFWKDQIEKAEKDLQKREDEIETNNKQTEDCGGNR